MIESAYSRDNALLKGINTEDGSYLLDRKITKDANIIRTLGKFGRVLEFPCKVAILLQ